MWKAIIFFILFVIFFNEFLIFYLSFLSCSWPRPDHTKALILADTHLLGIYRGHWADKLKREWQMHRSFQSAITLLQPDVVFVLGDLFDEGQWGQDEQFKVYVDRFHSLFRVPDGVKLITVPGNHDIGFHYALSEQNLRRYHKAFGNNKGVEHLEVDGNHFILLNSMAMEGDGCRLCRTAEREILKVAESLDCAMNKNATCSTMTKTPYSRPIIMQHFPLYRKSDMECQDETPDLAPEVIRTTEFREKWEALSNVSTHFLLDKLRPRAVFSGHVHFGCKKWWKAPHNLWEYTVSSFSWRNNRRPSFLLSSISPQSIQVNYCFVPHEHTVFIIYGISVLFLVSYIVVACFKRYRSHSTSVKSSIKKER